MGDGRRRKVGEVACDVARLAQDVDAFSVRIKRLADATASLRNKARGLRSNVTQFHEQTSNYRGDVVERQHKLDELARRDRRR